MLMVNVNSFTRCRLIKRDISRQFCTHHAYKIQNNSVLNNGPHDHLHIWLKGWTNGAYQARGFNVNNADGRKKGTKRGGH